ncbi:Cytochrome P450 monooxygenase [Rasamsonia emersonii CBS 393.64]|uniref:Cytochrome P450 monooxygenase n=1 Tax=Rasamsonia emersonii (strain ATCC 16479 / CBS 393.64 / IMI 116815) TaxID=1408163 RepID=A0A0F4Z4T4_RASE3|nr:Cytochrome P450 monooxygenase [Rasamsonia emersonii CBS 393.64]KKA25527.1 Cytochrome P450 monooxygenase [Rasamsonia emersonii CBS 393.64]
MPSTLNLLHNGFSRRSWIRMGADWYKGSGRVKHEAHEVRSGPFQTIVIDSRQACPGRFFAAATIKVIVMRLLEEFDLKLVDEKAGRPKNRIKGAMSFPSETAEIMFRRRQ